MHVQIEIADGPLAGQRYDLNEGESLSVGRTAKSQCVLAYDSYLSGLHFQIEVDARGCVLRDANSSNGTYVNDERVASEVELHDGDRVVAGETRFLIRTGAAQLKGRTTLLMRQPSESLLPGGVAAPPLEAPHRMVVDHLRKSSGSVLYGLVDAAADASLSMLVAAAHQHQTLGPGAEGAPVLVNVASQQALLPELVRAAWGRNRMVFLTSNHPFESLRKHLRAFFLARTEDGRPFRLRLQDPGILQLFLNGCSAEEITLLFGPVDSFRMEDVRDAARLLEFTVTPVGLKQNIVMLAGDEGERTSAAMA